MSERITSGGVGDEHIENNLRSLGYDPDDVWAAWSNETLIAAWRAGFDDAVRIFEAADDGD